MSDSIAVIVDHSTPRDAFNSIKDLIKPCHKTPQLEHDLKTLDALLPKYGGARRKTARRKARKSRKSRSRK